MKFQCQETCGGKCCKIPQGKELFVFLTGADRLRIANFLNKQVKKFAKQSHFEFTRFSGKGWFWHLKAKGDRCRFLSKEGRCEIYEVRPTQCATWPMWPENMKPETQEMFMKVCPGIGMGPELPEAEVIAKISEQEKADGVYATKKC